MHLAITETELECGKCHRMRPAAEYPVMSRAARKSRAKPGNPPGPRRGPRSALRGNRGAWCKACKKAYDRAHRAKQDPAAKKKRATDLYLRHRETLLPTFWGSCHRAKKAGAVVTLTHDEWRAINAETECHWCGLALHESFRNIDHLVPLVEGGEHSKSNLVSACANCNMRREWERKTFKLRKGASV